MLEHEELGVYRLLSRLPLDELRRHRAEAIGPLLEYDREHNGALVHTLEVFLRCERNRVQRGEELFIHYNTLRYRLGQIDALTGGLSGDATARLNLELALCAHRLVLGREDVSPVSPRRRAARPSVEEPPQPAASARRPRAACGRAARSASRCGRRRGR